MRTIHLAFSMCTLAAGIAGAACGSGSNVGGSAGGGGTTSTNPTSTTSTSSTSTTSMSSTSSTSTSSTSSTSTSSSSSSSTGTGGGSTSSCTDGVKNGDETDVDCGGSTCKPCGPGHTCVLPHDCTTADCQGGTCVYAQTCKALLAAGNTKSGSYTIDPDASGPIAPFAVNCDMTTDGGGWTEITLDIARNKLGGTITNLSGPMPTFDAQFRPCSAPDGAGTDQNHYDFQFPGGYTQFFLKGYQAKANSAAGVASDITPSLFIQQTWAVGWVAGGEGDISFGSPSATGPATSYAKELNPMNATCETCTIDWPAGTKVYALGASSSAFRVSAGEAGPESEGWCPWWAGTILLR